MFSLVELSAFVCLIRYAAAQSIDPSTVPQATRDFWCLGQTTQCPLICTQYPGQSAATYANDCDPDTLVFNCVCESNGLSPNVSEYSQTIPYFICTENNDNCVTACNGASSCQSACRENNPCGAQDPTRVNETDSEETATSSTIGAAASTAADGAVYTGFGGSNSGSNSGSDSDSDKSGDTIAIKDAQFRSLTTPVSPSTPLQRTTDLSETPSSPEARQNWQRVGLIARRANTDDSQGSPHDDESSSENESLSPEKRLARRKAREQAREARRKAAKGMELQYFLEMVDQKHRHGSNLRKYHNYWKAQDTTEGFFYWLDQGEGRDIELEECSRAKLNKEQVRYLSREERMKYLVIVDKKGLLRWAKNNETVWTNDALFRDSMEGIVPLEDTGQIFRENISSETVVSISSEDESDGAVAAEKTKTNKWIYVADTSFRLFVGIKQRGSFQHSSFLHGSRISAAGEIKIKQGHLRTLKPLSGHYRPSSANFRAFLNSLRAEGVDMSQVSLSKSYALLMGIEGYAVTKKKVKEVKSGIEHQKDKILHPQTNDSANHQEETKLPASHPEQPQSPKNDTLHRLARSLRLHGNHETGK